MTAQGAGRGRLRALDDSFDRLLRRHGTSLMGDDADARPSRRRFLVYGVVIVIVAVARLIGGDAPLPVIVGAVIFAVACGLVLRWKSRRAEVESAATRQQMAARQVRIGGLLLAAIGVAFAFAFAGAWPVTGLLVFLAVFFNGAVWFIKRYDQPRKAKQP